MTFSPRAIEAALAKFNEVINDPIMEPCPRCNGVGYQGFGSDEPDWCKNCGGNHYNIRLGEEKRAMESALSAALAVDGVALVPREPTGAMLDALAEECRFTWGVNVKESKPRPLNFKSEWRERMKPLYHSLLAAASDGEDRPSPPQQEKP